MNYPMAYHITFGTYGTRLHGDERPTVTRKCNVYRTPTHPSDAIEHGIQERRLKYPKVWLTIQQRMKIEDIAQEICASQSWTFHACAAASDHVHTVISAQVEGKDVRKWYKHWVSKALNTIETRPGPWWAEGGSVKWIYRSDYLRAAIAYVAAQRTPR